jgi:hypothetical protein
VCGFLLNKIVAGPSVREAPKSWHRGYLVHRARFTCEKEPEV